MWCLYAEDGKETTPRRRYGSNRVIPYSLGERRVWVWFGWLITGRASSKMWKRSGTRGLRVVVVIILFYGEGWDGISWVAIRNGGPRASDQISKVVRWG